jgi:hypothetical protein
MENNLIPHRETDLYQKVVSDILESVTKEKLTEFKDSFKYVIETYGWTHIRFHNQDTNVLHVVNHFDLLRKMKYLNVDHKTIFDELKKVNIIAYIYS